MRTRVKICGVTRPEDAKLASELGADAVGMIFHPPSRRCVSVERAKEIVSALGAFVTPVGVFVDAPTVQIVEMAESACLGLVQLHGQETPSQAQELARQGVRMTKSIKVDDSLMAQLDVWRNALPELGGALVGLVLETAGAAPGGTGIANDFGAIRRYQEQGLFEGLPPVIVAGGLDPGNVGGVIELLEPYAVDVSSGVEGKAIGHKDAARLRAFIAASSATSREAP